MDKTFNDIPDDVLKDPEETFGEPEIVRENKRKKKSSAFDWKQIAFEEDPYGRH